MRQKYLALVLSVFILSTSSFLAPQFNEEELAQRNEIEEFLKTAEITKAVDIGEGVTKPYRLYLTKGEIVGCGCWKNPSGVQKGFIEGWQYEIAAYEMDKLVGLNMIPPTVEREYKGKRGSLQHWITSEMSDLERLERGIDIPPDKLESWTKQKYLARAFDCLVANEDRTQQNIRYTADWRTILIDHSRSFRSSDEFRKRLVLGKNGLLAQKLFRTLPRIFVDEIRILDFDSIKAAAGAYLNDKEIQAVLERRDLLISEIEEMIKERGESSVLY